MMYLLQTLAFFQSGKTESPIWFNMFPFVIMFALMYFFLLRPQMKQQKELRKMIDNLKKGDKIVTNGGIWGEIDSVEPQFFRIKVSEKTKIVVSRSSVTGLQQPLAGKEEAK